MHTIFDALSMLRPFDIDLNKIRIGPRGDGGYVLADAISSDQAVLSYGIADQYDFDLELAQAGHQVYMFDPTVDLMALPSENMKFFKEGCAGASDGSKMFTILDHITNNDITGNRLIMKMDVEAAEYDAILAMPDDLLERFEQIVMEVHHLADLGQPEFREKFCEFMTKLNRKFTLFHVHANNFDGPEHFTIIDGLPTVNLIELSLIKTTSVHRTVSQTVYPTSLDAPNGGPREKLLWMFPYYPTSLPLSHFSAVWDRVLRT